MSLLVRDEQRTDLVAANIAHELRHGHCVLVLSKRLAHLDAMMSRVAAIHGDDSRLFMFTGRQSTDRRMEVQAEAEKGSCVLFSTIADEALDIPRIDRIHFAWPTRNTDIIRQQIGRGERPHPEKKDVVVNDYLDDVGPLKGQLRDRVDRVYIPDKLVIDASAGI
jgi:superfamily II DNA or RNA helicase